MLLTLNAWPSSRGDDDWRRPCGHAALLRDPFACIPLFYLQNEQKLQKMVDIVRDAYFFLSNGLLPFPLLV
jgi:hypothetical protein